MSGNIIFPNHFKTVKNILILLAIQKQAAGWFWPAGHSLLTHALVDLTEYGESRINGSGTLKIYQPNISYPKARLNKGHSVPIEVIKYYISFQRQKPKLIQTMQFNRQSLYPFFFEVKIKIKKQLDTCYIVSAFKRSHSKFYQMHLLCKSFRINAFLERRQKSILNVQLRY